jgi:hypothetical protein
MALYETDDHKLRRLAAAMEKNATEGKALLAEFEKVRQRLPVEADGSPMGTSHSGVGGGGAKSAAQELTSRREGGGSTVVHTGTSGNARDAAKDLAERRRRA